MKSSKGSAFEREICTMLSEWWEPGRSDIFWRSQGSGGRATRRAKNGKSTYGSCGDIAAVDPIGAPLMKVATIELKRGYSKCSIADIIDKPKHAAVAGFESFVAQAITAAKNANSLSWMLITRRDKKISIVYIPTHFYAGLCKVGALKLVRPSVHVVSEIRRGKFVATRTIVGFPLNSFLENVTRKHIETIANGKVG